MATNQTYHQHFALSGFKMKSAFRSPIFHKRNSMDLMGFLGVHWVAASVEVGYWASSTALDREMTAWGAGARAILGGMWRRRRHRSGRPRLMAMGKPSVHGADDDPRGRPRHVHLCYPLFVRPSLDGGRGRRQSSPLGLMLYRFAGASKVNALRSQHPRGDK